MVGVASQLSLAVAVPVFAGNVLAVHCIVILGGHTNEGATLSSTTMVCTQLLELPQSSVVTHVRVIVLSCGHAPPRVTSLKVTVGVASQLSEDDAVPVFAGNVLAVHCMVTFGGHVIEGATLSSTTMVCAQVLELPQSSVATHVRVIVLSCGHAPPTVTSLKVIVGVGSQSVAVADPVFAGNVLAVHWMVKFGGQEIVGGVLSLTWII